jgi:hypothetical protein
MSGQPDARGCESKGKPIWSFIGFNSKPERRSKPVAEIGKRT